MMTDGAADEIKQRLDIVEVVGDYVALKRSGQNFKGLCPFHAEKTPSFMVSQPKQIYHCFGCGAGGDLFAFVMKHEGLTFPEALEMLAKRAGVELKPRSPGERGLKEAIKSANATAQEFFAANLAKSPRARGYLDGRGVSGEARRAFALGYAPEGWHALGEHLGRKGFTGEQLLKAGLNASGAKGPYDVFRGRLIFPIFDLHGDIVAFGGRALGEGRQQQPKYLNSPDTPVFKKRQTLYALQRAREAIREAGEAVVVEGYLDAIACHQGGVANAVAPLGTALTPEHVRMLARYAPRVKVVFDGDQAGVAAARRSLETILAQGLPARVLLLPEGQDPDSVLREEGAESFREMLKEKALSPVEFVLRTSEAGKTGAVMEALGLIARVEEPLRRDELLGELADLSGTRELTLREQMARLKAGGGRQPRGGTPAAGAGGFAYNEETFLLSAAISDPGRAGEILGRLSAEDFGDRIVRGIFEKLGASPAAAAAELEGASEEERALITRLSLEPGFDPDEADRVVEDCIRQMEKRHLDRKIEEARSSGDMALLGSLLSERQRLLQEAR
ncbi:MAG: DNA primase [Nitrospirota bacterium]|jgi:DNA primase